jgi:L-ascorbate metabolism protein UlaG (beta-lactamase superfamily)
VNAAVSFLGHATILVEMDGVRLLTDPVIRDRVGPILRVVAPVERRHLEDVDAILISHLHLDHLDLASLRSLPRGTRLIVPAGAARVVRGVPLRVEELALGRTTAVGAVTVRATYADHSGYRPPFGPRAEPLGFVIEGSRRIYFAGDTDLFDGMTELGAPGLDLALLPVWGWGPRLGPGHMDPKRAADALALLRPRLGVPIHWGTLWAQGLGPLLRHRLTTPPLTFQALAAERAPGVAVRVLRPTGERLPLG